MKKKKEIEQIISNKTNFDINQYAYTNELKKIKDFISINASSLIQNNKFNKIINEIFFDYLKDNLKNIHNTQDFEDNDFSLIIDNLKKSYLKISNFSINEYSNYERKLNVLIKDINEKKSLDLNVQKKSLEIINLFKDDGNFRFKYFPLCLNINKNLHNIYNTKQLFNDEDNSLSLEYNYKVQTVYYSNIYSVFKKLENMEIKELLEWKNIKELIYIFMIYYTNPFDALLIYLKHFSEGGKKDFLLWLYNNDDSCYTFYDFFYFNNNYQIPEKEWTLKCISVFNKLNKIEKKFNEHLNLTIMFNDLFKYVYTEDFDDFNDFNDKSLLKDNFYKLKNYNIDFLLNDKEQTNYFTKVLIDIEFKNENEHSSINDSNEKLQMIVKTNFYKKNILNINKEFVDIFNQIINLEKDKNENQIMLYILLFFYIKIFLKDNELNIFLEERIENEPTYFFKNSDFFKNVKNTVLLLNSFEEKNIYIKNNKENDFFNNKIHFLLNNKKDFSNSIILDVKSINYNSLNNDDFYKLIIGKITILKYEHNKIEVIKPKIFIDKIDNNIKLNNLARTLELIINENNIENIVYIANLDTKDIQYINNKKNDKNTDIFDYTFLRELKNIIIRNKSDIEFIPLFCNKLNILYYDKYCKSTDVKKMIVVKDDIAISKYKEIGDFLPIFRLYSVVNEKTTDNDIKKSSKDIVDDKIYNYAKDTVLYDYNIKDKNLNHNIDKEEYESVYLFNKYANNVNTKELNKLKDILALYSSIKEELDKEEDIKNLHIKNLTYNKNDKKYVINILGMLNEIREVIEKKC